MKIEVLKDISSANDAIAAQNRLMLDMNGVFTVNLMSSPGAGKTSFILQTISHLRDTLNFAVIEGDVASKVDADTIDKQGIPVLQINIGGNCSLEAHMISSALPKMELKDIDVLIIENVGNLICPAEFALGEHTKVVLASTPEGHDKPIKYPLMFTEADVILVNKIDLAPYLDFDADAFRTAVKGLNPDISFFDISCKTGSGIDEWCSWLSAEVSKYKSKK
jgi:hydrogenase nickel incorporation protein HypB